MARKNKDTTVKDLIEIFLPKLWIILLVGVLLAGMIGTYSLFFKKDTYTASAEIYIYNKKATGSSAPTTGDIAAAEEMVNIYERAIGGGEFLDQVRVKLFDKGFDLSTSAIKRMISITKVEDVPNFIINVTSGSPDLSAELASIIVNDGISGGVLEGIIENNLASRVIEKPKTTENIKANGKNTVRNTIIAFFAGAIVAAICIWVFTSFDVTIRSQKKIEDNLDIPVLGIMPRHDVTSGTEVKE